MFIADNTVATINAPSAANKIRPTSKAGLTIAQDAVLAHRGRIVLGDAPRRRPAGDGAAAEKGLAPTHFTVVAELGPAIHAAAIVPS